MKKTILYSLVLLASASAFAAPTVSYQMATNIAKAVSGTTTSNVVTKAYVEGLGISGGGVDTNAVKNITRPMIADAAVAGTNYTDAAVESATDDIKREILTETTNGFVRLENWSDSDYKVLTQREYANEKLAVIGNRAELLVGGKINPQAVRITNYGSVDFVWANFSLTQIDPEISIRYNKEDGKTGLTYNTYNENGLPKDTYNFEEREGGGTYALGESVDDKIESATSNVVRYGESGEITSSGHFEVTDGTNEAKMFYDGIEISSDQYMFGTYPDHILVGKKYGYGYRSAEIYFPTNKYEEFDVHGEWPKYTFAFTDDIVEATNGVLKVETDPTVAAWARAGMPEPMTDLTPATNYTDAATNALAAIIPEPYVPSATDPTFSAAVLGVGIGIDPATLQWLKDIGAIAGSTTGQVGLGTLLAALLAALMWLKNNKADKSELPYPLNTDGTIQDRAVNEVTSGAFVIPEGFKDLLIRYTGVPASITFSGADVSIADYGDDLPTETGDYLITVTRTKAAECFIRVVKLEERA